jgi:CheY-like chemotaxis protein
MLQKTDAPASCRVLLVEDHPDGRETLKLLLELCGYQVEAAADGRQGVEKGLAWRPEVAVVDIGLPLLDGYEVARRLRAALGGRVRLIALTAYGGRRTACGPTSPASTTTSPSRWTRASCCGCSGRADRAGAFATLA